MYTRIPEGQSQKVVVADTQLSAVMSTEGATAAGTSEVDGFAKGGGQVGFSERLGHRLQEKGQKNG